MQNGDALKARQALSPHIGVSPLFFFIYCATYFPAVIWHKLYELRFAIGDITKKLRRLD